MKSINKYLNEALIHKDTKLDSSGKSKTTSLTGHEKWFVDYWKEPGDKQYECQFAGPFTKEEAWKICSRGYETYKGDDEVPPCKLEVVETNTLIDFLIKNYYGDENTINHQYLLKNRVDMQKIVDEWNNWGTNLVYDL